MESRLLTTTVYVIVFDDTGKRRNLTAFERVMIVVAGSLGESISETASFTKNTQKQELN